MTERPIIFSAPMVRAILDGRKTQTRRVAKLTSGGHVKEPRGNRRWHPADPAATAACPYGQVGDRLWVREAWWQLLHETPVRYRADNNLLYDEVTWRPSIFMPRCASRITLAITDVRVERLQAITRYEARAEGIPDGGCLSCGESEPCGCPNPRPDARYAFVWLWDSINAKRGHGWDSNPWVWAITFERIA